MAKELSEEQRQRAEMTREQEIEIIIKNAFEFLKMEDLIVIQPDIDMVANKSKYINNEVCSIMITNKIIDIQYYKDEEYYTLSLPSNEYTELYNAIMQRYNELLKLAETQQTERPHRETLEETRKWREEQEKQYKDNAQPQDPTDYTIKYDQNKPKLSQFPREAMEAVAEVMEYGARKYGGGTWNRVEIQRYIDAGARHLYAMQDIDENGKEYINLSKVDEESGLEHLYHLACNVVYAVALYKRRKNETR